MQLDTTSFTITMHRLARYPLVLLLYAFACNSAVAQWHKQQQAIMGTSVSVELWHKNRLQANKCIALVMNNMRRIDSAMSPYKENSELSRLNRTAAADEVKLSKELFQLISRAREISKLTHGQFDITFASAGHLYDYRKSIRPSADKLDKVLKAINYQHLQLNHKKRSIHFSDPMVRIDLGGIAKGYAVDQGIKILKQCGVTSALISAGGDSRILGDRQGLPWMTGIRHPRDKNGFAVVLPLTDTAISTSGDYERYFMVDGVRYHHIISPSTGKPADQVQSVTILGRDSTTTDALSTAIFVMGPEQGLQAAEKLPAIEAIIIDNLGKVHYTSGLLPPDSNN